MILDLRGNNDKLHILLRMLQAAQPFYTEQRSRRAKDVFGVREEIRRVHQVLSQYCHCTCTPAHEAKLSLRRGYCERKLLDQACFDTILYQTPLIPHHTTIRFAHSASSASGRKVRISIQKDDGDHSGHDGQREALADLCRAMSTCQANLARLNLIIDDESKLWAVQVPQTSPPAESAHFYTLETLLGASSRYKKEPKWLAKEKCIFAVILCHSLLHLDGTQWLKDGWHAENIKCVQDEQLCLAKATRFQLNHPYISADIMAADASLTTAAQSLTVDKSHGHPIPGLLTLGIILLELYLNGPLESAEDVERLANVHLWAISVLESCREDKDMDASYYNAIQFCLWPPAGRCTFENTKFRDDYYQKVVVPLEEALTEGFDFSENEMAGL